MAMSVANMDFATRLSMVLTIGSRHLGRASISAASQTRQDYVGVLKAADAGDMTLLLAFARS